ncbi:GIY-YIG nuclease family protein [Bacillus massiliigorillae]|uniref:GIY-YIG nuclease family protein n=1 Tax=Bacillus massiliigorillae TaxID=1243664 RepID=UPI00039A1BED|nr:GIY-YIG nuclease family protein [Bacillus massiliigorillae]
MERKKELKQLYKETPIEAGVYQITNTKNQKIFVASTRNLKTLNGVKFMLKNGGHMNSQLQEDAKQFGADIFEFEILEVLKKKETGFFDEKKELEKLEEKWINELQPFGERGYNA